MVVRWDIICIGNLSRNRYWGEAEDRPVRAALCTSTLITGEGFCLLVDPAFDDGDRMASELNRRSGLGLDDVTAVFITHEHGDHHAGLLHFPAAAWLAAPEVAEAINSAGAYDKAVDAVEDNVCDGLRAIHTPGHTPGHHSLQFDCEGQTVVVAGDAVMTRDFWRDRRGSFNSKDPARAAQTIDALTEMAHVIVPGHDNYFVSR